MHLNIWKEVRKSNIRRPRRLDEVGFRSPNEALRNGLRVARETLRKCIEIDQSRKHVQRTDLGAKKLVVYIILNCIVILALHRRP